MWFLNLVVLGICRECFDFLFFWALCQVGRATHTPRECELVALHVLHSFFVAPPPVGGPPKTKMMDVWFY